MSLLDWSIVGLYVIAALVIGAWFTRKASASKDDFFVAGRSLPWFVAGTSMVATTFSSDTPLFVAGLVRTEGIYANWIWWGGMIGVLVSVFFFARLWRRSEAVTEIEFIAQRYDPGMAVNGLRIFKAAFDGVLINCIIMASVTLAMSKVIVAVLGLSDMAIFTLPVLGEITPTMAILASLAIAAVAYTALSGLYGVVYTDLIQFALAMIGAIALAIISWVDLQSRGGFVELIKTAPGYTDQTLQMFPTFGMNLETLTFFVYILILPLYSAVGPGFFLQRVLASKTERDAAWSMGWFSICHMILRSWPWVVVAAASLVYFPVMSDGEQAYPAMLNELLPVGLKGIMVASLLAAFMSTLDTHLNWGSSYIVNDIYEPFLVKDKSRKHYVTVGRIAMLALALMALTIAASLTSILAAYQYLGVMIVGPAVILILRWYWWKINVWSEISVMVTSIFVGNALLYAMPDSEYFGLRALLTMALSTFVALLVTLLTVKAPAGARVVEFYRRLRVTGPGWQQIRSETGVDAHDDSLGLTAVSCIASVGALFGLMFLIGNLIFENSSGAVVSAAIFVFSAVVFKFLVGTTFRLHDK